MKKLNFKRWLSGFCIAAAVFGLSSCKDGIDLDAHKAKNDIVTTASIDDMTIDLPSSKALFKLNGNKRPIFDWKGYLKANGTDVNLYCAVGTPEYDLRYVTLHGKLSVSEDGSKASIKINYQNFPVNGDFLKDTFYIAGFMGGMPKSSSDVQNVSFAANDSIYQVNSTENDRLLSKIPFYFPYTQIQKKDGRGIVHVSLKPLGALIAFRRPVNAIIPYITTSANQQETILTDGKIKNEMRVRTNAYSRNVVFGFGALPSSSAAVAEQPVVKVQDFNFATIPGGDKTLYEYNYKMISDKSGKDSVIDAPYYPDSQSFNDARSKQRLDSVQYITWGYGYPEGDVQAEHERMQKSNGSYFSVSYKLILPASPEGVTKGYKITKYGENDHLVQLPEWSPNTTGSLSNLFESGKNVMINPLAQSGLMITELYHYKTNLKNNGWNFWQYDMVELYNPNYTGINLSNYALVKTKWTSLSSATTADSLEENLSNLALFQDTVIANEVDATNANVPYSYPIAQYKSLKSQSTDNSFKVKRLVLGDLADPANISNNRYRKPGEWFTVKSDKDPIAAYWPVNATEQRTDGYPVINSEDFGLKSPRKYSNILEGGKTIVLGAGGIYSGFTSSNKIYSKDNTGAPIGSDGWDTQDFPIGESAGQNPGSPVLKVNLDNGVCQTMLGIDDGNEAEMPSLNGYKGIYTNSAKTTKTKRNWGYWNANSGTLQLGDKSEDKSGLMLVRLDKSQKKKHRVWIPTDMYRSVKSKRAWDTSYAKKEGHYDDGKLAEDSDKGFTMQRRRADVFPDKYGEPDNWVLRIPSMTSLGANDSEINN